MKDNSKQNQIEDELVDTYSYRGFTFPIYLNDYGSCFYTVFNDAEVNFGSFNSSYKQDLEYLVDDYLDTIYRFDQPYWGAKLEWFQNWAYRDIRLLYRNRILKIWLISNPELANIETVKAEAISILEKYLKIF